MSLLSSAVHQSKTSRLMRIGLILWVVWIMVALFGAVASIVSVFDGGHGAFLTLTYALGSIPVVGLAIWFVTGAIRWVLRPTE